MSIATVVTRGYGSFGSIADVSRAGWSTFVSPFTDKINATISFFLATNKGDKIRIVAKSNGNTLQTIPETVRVKIRKKI